MVAGWLFAGTLIGCGVKGPPKSLWQQPVSRVVDLAGEVELSWVELTWSLSEPLSRKQARHAKFIIYGEKSSLEMEICRDCPRAFEKMATIGYADRDDGRYEARVPVDAEYRYVFKVNLVAAGSAGSDSDIVKIDVLSQTPAEN